MENELIDIFERANKRFLGENVSSIKSNVAERSLCSTLAQCLYLEISNSNFSRYHVDVEYNRNKGKVKTIYDDNLEVVSIVCDLIVHSRGKIIENDNLIALEMKKAYRPMKEKEKDRARLVALTKESYDGVWSFDGRVLPEHVCGYKLGIYYEIDNKKNSLLIEYYVRGEKMEVVIVYFSSKDSYRIRNGTHDNKNISGKKVIAEVEYFFKKFNVKKITLLCTKVIAIWTYIGKEHGY